MMPSDFIKLDGTSQEFDLDTARRLVRGYSKQRQGWEASVVYSPERKTFIEVRSSPQDYRGNSKFDEAEEVPLEYISEAYGIDKNAIESFLRSPQTWKLVNQR